MRGVADASGRAAARGGFVAGAFDQLGGPDVVQTKWPLASISRCLLVIATSPFSVVRAISFPDTVRHRMRMKPWVEHLVMVGAENDHVLQDVEVGQAQRDATQMRALRVSGAVPLLKRNLAAALAALHPREHRRGERVQAEIRSDTRRLARMSLEATSARSDAGLRQPRRARARTARAYPRDPFRRVRDHLSGP
jgi:hypothetical protein